MKHSTLDKFLEDWDEEENVGEQLLASTVNKKENVIRSYNTGPPYSGGLSPFQRLTQYSITGQSEKLRHQMLADQFVLKNIAIMGQWTTIYGAPNSGKTLITNWLLRESIVSDALDGEMAFYINADDNYRGLVDKIELAEDWGMHVIAPHHNYFDVGQVSELMDSLGHDGSARGVIIILDTLKKFTDLMDKRIASEFGKVARGFVSAGGTLITLAHTNKHGDADGKAVYSGTSDIVDDSDCCFIIDKVSSVEQYGTTTHTVEFRNHKARGDVASKVGFTYEKRHGQAYSSLLDTVKRVDRDELEEIKGKATVQSELDEETPIIRAICEVISAGIVSKTKIIKAAHESSGQSVARVRHVLNKRTGDIYRLGHRWRQKTESHNRHLFEILPAHS